MPFRMWLDLATARASFVSRGNIHSLTHRLSTSCLSLAVALCLAVPTLDLEPIGPTAVASELGGRKRARAPRTTLHIVKLE
jgi:hypothetical protein